MAGSSEKGQSLVELIFVLMAILVFATVTASHWETFAKETTAFHFSKSTRTK